MAKYHPVADGTPTDGYVLTYVAANSDWEPRASSGGTTTSGIVVSSVTALRASTYHLTTTLITLDGYAASGDGAFGIWSWKATSSAADNAGTVIKPNSVSGNGRWLRNFSDYSPKFWGAVGNGIADDILPFEQMHAALPVITGGSIRIPPGNYKLSRSWIISKSCIITGDGGLRGLSKITLALGASIITIRPADGTIISNLWIAGSVAPVWQANHTYVAGAIVANTKYHSGFTQMLNVCTVGGVSGATEPTWIVRDDNIVNGVSSATEGVTLTDGYVTWTSQSSPGIWCKALTNLKNLNIQNVPGDGIFIYGRLTEGTYGSGWRIDTAIAEGCMGRGLYVEGADAQVGFCNNFTAQNCWSGGIFDNSELGNTYTACLMEANGTFAWGPGILSGQYTTGSIVPTRNNQTGYFYQIVTPGTTGLTEPIWPTVLGNTIADGTAVWKCDGYYTYGQPYKVGHPGLNPSLFYGCYEEPDQINSEAYSPCIWDGASGGFFGATSTIWTRRARLNTNGIGFQSPTTVINPVAAVFGQTNLGDTKSKILEFSTKDATHSYALELSSDKKYWGFEHANSSNYVLQLSTEDATEGASHVILPNGIYIGRNGKSGDGSQPGLFNMSLSANGAIPGGLSTTIAAGDTWLNNRQYWGAPTMWKNLTTGICAFPWQANHLYLVNTYVRSLAAPNGHVFLSTAGTSGATEPVWNTGTGATTTDNTVTWTEAGTSSELVDVAPAISEDLLIRTIVVADGYTITLTSREAAHHRIRLAGTLSGNTVVIIKTPFVKDSAVGPGAFSASGIVQSIGSLPNSFDKIIQNSTTGAFTLTIKTVTGDTGIVLAAGASQHMWSDGVNMVAV